MSKFEVGKKYRGWSRNCRTSPATLIVVSIAEDRQTLLAVIENGSDPKEAFTYKVRWDNRFGEKIVTGVRGMYTVWRADKACGEATIPEGWYDREEKKIQESIQRAAEALREKQLLESMRDKLNIEKFAKIYNALLVKNSHYYTGDEQYWLNVLSNSNIEFSEVKRGTEKQLFSATAKWSDGNEIHTCSFLVYTDCFSFGLFSTNIIGDEFKSYFK